MQNSSEDEDEINEECWYESMNVNRYFYGRWYCHCEDCKPRVRRLAKLKQRLDHAGSLAYYIDFPRNYFDNLVPSLNPTCKICVDLCLVSPLFLIPDENNYGDDFRMPRMEYSESNNHDFKLVSKDFPANKINTFSVPLSITFSSPNCAEHRSHWYHSHPLTPYTQTQGFRPIRVGNSILTPKHMVDALERYRKMQVVKALDFFSLDVIKHMLSFVPLTNHNV